MRSTTAPCIAAGVVAAALTVAARPAHANGRFPASNQIVFSPTNQNTMVGRTTFGFLPSVDDGATWRWICEDVLALPSAMSSDPELAITASGALVAGTPAPYELGVSTSADLGCNWSCSNAIGATPVADIVLRASSPHAVLALLGLSQAADGGALPAQVYETTDDGVTWRPHGAPFDPTDSTLQVLSIDVAKTDASRIYVSAVRGGGPTRRASLFVSKDDATTWTEHPLTAFDPTTEGTLYIAAVDPTDADRVYVRSAGVFASSISADVSCDMMYGGSRLFVTSDAGSTFATADLPTHCQILGFALSADGSRVYAGTYGEGLFAASRSDLKFTKTSSIHVECLATRGAELWACSDAASGFIFGSSTDEGACFQARLPQLTNLAGPIDCKADPASPLACMAKGNASICTNDAFQSLCDTPFSLNPGCFTDAGAPDAGCGSPAPAPPPGHGGSCGCSTVGGADRTGLLALAALLAWASAAALRRRR